MMLQGNNNAQQQHAHIAKAEKESQIMLDGCCSRVLSLNSPGKIHMPQQAAAFRAAEPQS
jgi:hypothetical protein